MPENKIKLRGFGSMSKIDRSLIASMGGRAAHKKGTAHKFSSEEARLAGQKGGKAPRTKK